MHRDRISLVLFSLTLSIAAAVSCTTSETINMTGQTGHAGTTGSGTAGTTGTAGSTTGNAGTGAGTAGTTGAGGSITGTSGTTGTAGMTAGTAGASGSGGGGAGGTSGGTGGNGGAGGGMGGAGGAGNPDGGSGAILSFATDIYPFIKTQCTPCHITNIDGMLSMKDATTAYTNLVGTTMGVAAKTNLTCTMLSAAKKRVVPGDPAHSYIYIKTSMTNAALMPAGCQPAMPEMPQSTLTLTTDQVTKIHDWIMGGAKP
jgi:hypothetical protein